MAYGDSFTPSGAQGEIKVRGPLWVGLWSITGVYAVYWIYQTAKHLRDYGNARGRDLGQNPTMTLLAVLIGWIIIVPPIVAIYRQAKRIQQVQQMNGVQPLNGWLALVLYLVVSPALFAYEQSELNKAWAAEGGPVQVDGVPAATGTLSPAPTAPESVTPSGMPASSAGDPLQAPTSPERPGQ